MIKWSLFCSLRRLAVKKWLQNRGIHSQAKFNEVLHALGVEPPEVIIPELLELMNSQQLTASTSLVLQKKNKKNKKDEDNVQ